MKMTAFRAVCPVEIGDVIFIIENKAYYLTPGVEATENFWFSFFQQAERRTIEDIATTMYCKSGNVEFQYKLNGEQEYRKLNVVTVTSIP